jgi:hypothetical protein
MPRRISLAGLLAALMSIGLLAGCGRPALPADKDAELRAVFDKVRAGDLAAIEASFDLQSRDSRLHAVLPRLRAQIPPGPARVRLLQASQRLDGEGREVYAAVYEYDFPGRGLIVQTAIRRDAMGRPAVLGFRLTPTAENAVDANRFALAGRPSAQYGFLALGLLSLALVLGALIALWRGPAAPSRWLWTAAMLAGVGDLTMNWTSGGLAAHPLTLHLLTVSAGRTSPFNPWTLSVSAPLAAIAYLLWRVSPPGRRTRGAFPYRRGRRSTGA